MGADLLPHRTVNKPRLRPHGMAEAPERPWHDTVYSKAVFEYHPKCGLFIEYRREKAN
jgi:hypothetical protein